MELMVLRIYRILLLPKGLEVFVTSKMKLLLCISFFVSLSAQAEEFKFTEHTQKTLADGFDKTGLWILGIGGIASLVASNFDNQVHDSWKGHQQMSPDLSKYGDFWGTGIPQALIFAGQTYYDKENGIPAFEGFILGGIVTHSAKLLIGRERPDSHTRTAMPSGHSQAAFSIAASMTESYGWKVGLPFWCMGVFTGLTRLADNAHWLSDVVAGATVGTFFGRAGYKHHQQIQPLVFFNEGKVEGVGITMRLTW